MQTSPEAAPARIPTEVWAEYDRACEAAESAFLTNTREIRSRYIKDMAPHQQEHDAALLQALQDAQTALGV